MICEAALVLAAELAQRQQNACLAATMDESYKMNWLTANLRSRWPIFIIAASWFPSAGDGVFISRWYNFGPRGLLLPMFGYTNRMRYLSQNCRQSYQGVTMYPEL